MKAFDDGLPMGTAQGVAGTAMDVKRSRSIVEKFKLRVPQKETNLDMLVRWKQLPKQGSKLKKSLGRVLATKLPVCI